MQVLLDTGVELQVPGLVDAREHVDRRQDGNRVNHTSPPDQRGLPAQFGAGAEPKVPRIPQRRDHFHRRPPAIPSPASRMSPAGGSLTSMSPPYAAPDCTAMPVPGRCGRRSSAGAVTDRGDRPWRARGSVRGPVRDPVLRDDRLMRARCCDLSSGRRVVHRGRPGAVGLEQRAHCVAMTGGDVDTRGRVLRAEVPRARLERVPADADSMPARCDDESRARVVEVHAHAVLIDAVEEDVGRREDRGRCGRGADGPNVTRTGGRASGDRDEDRNRRPPRSTPTPVHFAQW